MKLIVGLGNPGKEYDNTRHNIGFKVIDEYLGNVDWQKKSNALYCKINKFSETIYFLKPTTFMNLSGIAVREFINYYNIETKDILIIQDDLDQPCGQYKLKKNSSSGGHNGIKSIIKELGTDSFSRLKIGINTDKKYDTIDFVLGRLSSSEINEFEKNKSTYKEIIDSFIKDGIEKTMNIYNTK